MIDTIITLFSEMLLGIFGSHYILGGFTLFLFIIIGLAMRLTADAWIVIITPLLWILSKAGFLPWFLEYVAYVFLGIIIALGIARLVRRT